MSSGSEIPKDVLIEILKRLPVKSIWRLRLVSTTWFSVISDPDFVRCYDALSNTTGKILVMDSDAGPSREWLTYDADRSVPVAAMKLLNISGCSTYLPSRSVRGLVCLGGKDAYDIHILNPTTREFYSIAHPPFPGIDSPSFRYQFCFGFDPVANKHKVLYTFEPCDPECQATEVTQHWIYTLGGAEEWRMADVFSNYPAKSYLHGEVCVDGVVYFLTLIYDPDNGHPCYYLAAFDLRSESFNTVKLTIPYWNPHRCSLIEYNGSVALVDNGLVDKARYLPLFYTVEIKVWVLEDIHKQAWVLKRSILVLDWWSEIIGDQRLRLACALLGGKLLLFAPIEIGSPGFDLFFCDVETNDFWKNRIDVPEGDAFARRFYSGVVFSDHIETLLPLRGLAHILDRPEPEDSQSSNGIASTE